MTSQKEHFYIQRIAELEEQVAKLIKVNEALVKKNAELADKVANPTFSLKGVKGVF